MMNKASNATDIRNSRTFAPPTRVEIYALIDYRTAAAPCAGKTRYSESDAREAADAHNQRFVCGDMEAYPCAAHRAWHIGHANFRRGKNLQFREDYAWFVLWAAGGAETPPPSVRETDKTGHGRRRRESTPRRRRAPYMPYIYKENPQMPSEATTNELNDLLQELEAKKREIDKQRDAVITTIRLLNGKSEGEGDLPPAPGDDGGDKGDSVPW